MKIALSIDGLLCEPSSHLQNWIARGLAKENVEKNESFWASLPAYDDVKSSARTLTEATRSIDSLESPLFLTERPVSLLSVTTAWLRVQGFSAVTREQVVCQTIKRYDCRLNAVDIFLDSSRESLLSFVYDNTQPVYVDRSQEGQIMNGRVKNYDFLDEAIEWALDQL